MTPKLISNKQNISRQFNSCIKLPSDKSIMSGRKIKGGKQETQQSMPISNIWNNMIF